MKFKSNIEKNLIRNLILRYLSIVMLLFIITSNIFSSILIKFLTFNSFIFTNYFFGTELINGIIVYNGHELLIIDACLGLSNYILFTLLFLSMQIKFKTSIKAVSYTFILFTFLNFLRIIFLMSILIIYGEDSFEKFHLAFIYTINTIITIGTFILTYKTLKLRKKPFIDDIIFLIKSIKKPIKNGN